MVKNSGHFENHKNRLILVKSKYLPDKSFEYGTLIFKDCAASEVTIENYVGSI